jgi:hypothetical protein
MVNIALFGHNEAAEQSFCTLLSFPPSSIFYKIFSHCLSALIVKNPIPYDPLCMSVHFGL